MIIKRSVVAKKLKHGPIALLDEAMRAIVITPQGRAFGKTLSNVQGVAARGGKVILIASKKGAAQASVEAFETIVLPGVCLLCSHFNRSAPGSS